MAKGRTDLKKRTKTAKNGKSKNSLYFVDNPDKNELKLLSSVKTKNKQEEQEVELHQSLALAEVDDNKVEEKSEQDFHSNEVSEQPDRHDEMVKEALQEKEQHSSKKELFIPTTCRVHP
ncbi:hypothetical protein RE628_22190 [Paenibacillus sp. D2_2]|uniref:hypothetical protein n=1 Tax=Paenibacillus sp. D2_2 TaxID=3073092 RepID=UPI002815810D|nr:hypothetical protein [Paenibacillus sp. D2_2]WMT40014.1 hypothetical protein RE628_22190 [Paenibacillus sp. D2_2]